MKSITDKAEVSIDFPDKAYMGSFGRESSFDVKVESEEVLLRIVREGEQKRVVALHLHYYLLADILTEIGEGLADRQSLDRAHLEALQQSVKVLTRAMSRQAAKRQK